VSLIDSEFEEMVRNLKVDGIPNVPLMEKAVGAVSIDLTVAAARNMNIGICPRWTIGGRYTDKFGEGRCRKSNKISVQSSLYPRLSCFWQIRGGSHH
jgi:hypothetical protein